MQPELRGSLESMLGSTVSHASSVGGGDIGESWQIVLEGGERCFVKHYLDGPPRLAWCEAQGLEWLRDAAGVAVAHVRAVSEDHPILVLDWIESATRKASFDEELGRGLAKLHARGADRFGFDENNFIGSLDQRNHQHDSWAEFYAEERLEPLLCGRGRGFIARYRGTKKRVGVGCDLFERDDRRSVEGTGVACQAGQR